MTDDFLMSQKRTNIKYKTMAQTQCNSMSHAMSNSRFKTIFIRTPSHASSC